MSNDGKEIEILENLKKDGRIGPTDKLICSCFVVDPESMTLVTLDEDLLHLDKKFGKNIRRPRDFLGS